ncbi:hypothetical protein GNZ12_01010 [Paraburkholderia sp. 1N]|uniref:Uncharacterized protein n=1 Tax=Paraburkholderia solitsugae TaxID=2675748 RepID=A0ABX2BG63_9BURK|nr:hypothetical protein [Paraburkholderia solitsugae]NPT39924.1 hypothetical protein [Paraburkholderia solitsugae]
MNRPLALIDGALAFPKPRPFDGLPPPFGSRRRTARATAQDATQRASQPIAQTGAQRAMQDAVQRRAQQARPGPFPPGVKHLFFYKVPPQRVDSHRFDAALAEAKRYLEAGRARPRSSRSDHILGGAIFVGCSIALAWLLATCAMRDATKASELAVKLPVAPAVSSPPIVETQEPIKLAQLAVEQARTIPLSVPSVGKSTVADMQTAVVAEKASPRDIGPKRATQVLPRQTVQVIARDDEVATPPAKPAKRVNVTRLSDAHVSERMALNRATHPTTRPAMSKQPEWTAGVSLSRNDVSTDDAPWLNWSTQQHRPSPTVRAATPLDNSWNDHMTQRRITDDPAAFHTDRGWK